MKESSEESKSLAIEKQKTLRYMMVIVAIFLLAIAGIYVVFKATEKGGTGEVNVNFNEGKFSLSLEKPIVDQIKQGTAKTEGTNNQIQFTEGIIKDQKVIDQLKGLGSNEPSTFSGKNFINSNLGFLLSVPNPEKWKVSYNQSGIQNPLTPVNTFYSQEGSNLNVGIETIPQYMSIQQYVSTNIQTMFVNGVVQQMPQVTYDLPSETAFAIFTNPMTSGQSYQKVIINKARNQAFIASANYNLAISDPQSIQDLINMIASFTLF